MDTNTLQILVTLLAQQKAVPVVAVRSAVEITLLVLAALAPIILAFAGWIKAQSFQTDLREVKTDFKDVKEKVNGALKQMESLAHEKGMDNGRALERSEQAKATATITAVKEAIKERVSVSAQPPVVTQEQLVDALKNMPPTL